MEVTHPNNDKNSPALVMQRRGRETLIEGEEVHNLNIPAEGVGEERECWSTEKLCDEKLSF